MEPTDDWWTKNKLNELYICNGEYQKALSLSQEVLSENQESYKILYALASAGYVEIKLGHYEQAKQYFEKAQKVAEYPSAWFEHGYALLKMKNYEKAQQIFSQSLKFFKELKGMKSQDFDAHLQIANIYVIQGKHDEALQWLEKAAALDPIGYYWQVEDFLPYWDPLKNDKRYRKIMDPIEQSIAEWRNKIEKLEREGF